MKKKVLLVVPGSLYPTMMASQVRILDMIRSLSRSHQVDVVTLVSRRAEEDETRSRLGGICNRSFILQKPNRRPVPRFLFAAVNRLADLLLIRPSECFYPNLPAIRSKILGIIEAGGYDIVQVEFWLQSSLLKNVSRTFRVVDTHDVMHEKRTAGLSGGKAGKPSFYRRLWLLRYRNLERSALTGADLIISISKHDSDYFKAEFPGKRHILVPTGQDIRHFARTPGQKPDSVLFYGAMNSRQNIDGFWRLWNEIYPKIRRETGCPLTVLGGSPPDGIRKLARNDGVTVTGFVDDVRDVIAKALVMILPLRLSGGFRSRIVEVMAMGVPVVGTHNALDSVGMENGVHGFITDDDGEIADCSIRLIREKQLRSAVSRACIRFAAERYSLEKTYGELARYYATPMNGP